jgi:uncharacterized membrane protein YcaP (DUF421 family)
MNILFDSWASLGHTLIVALLAYVGLLLILRISGKRSLSKMNAFDFVVTVALGSTLATVLLSRDVALVDGLLAFGLLVGMQFVIPWFSVRSGRVAQSSRANRACFSIAVNIWPRRFAASA